jgi:A/G-specific adenine glycosylase
LNLDEFKGAVYAFYARSGREFPWRGENVPPWAVLVSEFMLQQTQTERVIPFFNNWMRQWPSPEALHNAPFEHVLRAWLGLGYNRRCRFLKECARVITTDYAGIVPNTPSELLKLPGIGAYTAGAIACFAYNYPSVFIETNIRAALIQFFFQNEAVSSQKVPDADLFPLLEAFLDEENRKNPRKWYYALMDFGADIKKQGANPNHISAHYVKQSKFEGSFRQMRGRVVKILTLQGASSAEDLAEAARMKKEDLYNVLEALKKDSMVSESQGIYRVKNQ